MSRAWDGSPARPDDPPQTSDGTAAALFEDMWLVARYIILFIVPAAVFMVAVVCELI